MRWCAESVTVLARRLCVRSPPSSSCRLLSHQDLRYEKPQPFQLEHVKIRLSETVHLYPRSRLDYTFYRPDVVLEDRILKEDLMSHWGLVSVVLKLFVPYVQFEALSVSTIVEDGTVRLRWRCHYISFFRLFTNLRLFRYDYRMKNLSWYDGIGVFRVDGNGDVFHVTIDRVMEDEERLRLASPTKKIAAKLGVVQATATKQSPQN